MKPSRLLYRTIAVLYAIGNSARRVLPIAIFKNIVTYRPVSRHVILILLLLSDRNQ
jgi:hypothetical protein